LPGASYRILGTTNVALPLVSVDALVTNQFGVSGGFSYTNAVQLNRRAQYPRQRA